MTIDKVKFEMFAFFEESVWGDSSHWGDSSPDDYSELYNLYNEQNELVGSLAWLDIKNGFQNCNTKEELDNLINVEWKYIDEGLSEGLNELLEDIETE